MKILNLHAGLGGNSNLWDDNIHEIVNVELDHKIADILKDRKPNQQVIIADAMQYLLDNFNDFDFIWASPPCQKHSKMVKATRHKKIDFVDPQLHQLIIFLTHFFKGKFVVENVVPYYEPYPGYQKFGRHLFWANFKISDFDLPTKPKGFINMTTTQSKKQMMDWLGIYYEKNIYYGKNHCPVQILRNCVHPEIGLHLLNCAMGKTEVKNKRQLEMFI